MQSNSVVACHSIINNVELPYRPRQIKVRPVYNVHISYIVVVCCLLYFGKIMMFSVNFTHNPPMHRDSYTCQPHVLMFSLEKVKISWYPVGKVRNVWGVTHRQSVLIRQSRSWKDTNYLTFTIAGEHGTHSLVNRPSDRWNLLTELCQLGQRRNDTTF